MCLKVAGLQSLYPVNMRMAARDALGMKFNNAGMGIKFTRKRLQRLSDFYKVDYSLQLNNAKSGGTEVTIILSSRFDQLMTNSEKTF